MHNQCQMKLRGEFACSQTEKYVVLVHVIPLLCSELFYVCVYTQYTKDTPRTACRLTNQRTAGTQGNRSVKAGEGRRLQQSR